MPRLHGRVVDEAFPTASGNQMAHVAPDGSCELVDVPCGEYQLRVERPPHRERPPITSVVITPGAEIRLDLE